MALVVLADDAYAFMVMWETMALSSFFLVTANHRIAEIRSAGYLYLLIAHIGAIAILLCFGVLQANTGDYTFANMRAQHAVAVLGLGRLPAGAVRLRRQGRPAAAARLAARGAPGGAVAGVGADERRDAQDRDLRPAARVASTCCSTQLWWWGVLLLALGLATALFGVVFAAVQVDMKRLLAYSSIENIGLLVRRHRPGADLLRPTACRPMAALALTATLYHVASHAFFKSLLFLGTGCVLHATGERNLGKLGGLIRYHALGGLGHAGRRAGQRRPAAAGRLRLRVAAAAELPVHARPARARC